MNVRLLGFNEMNFWFSKLMRNGFGLDFGLNRYEYFLLLLNKELVSVFFGLLVDVLVMRCSDYIKSFHAFLYN